MLQIIKPDNEEHWLAMRHKNINSTESPALFGMSPYNSKFELYHTKIDPDLVEFVDNERIEAGREMEPAIARLALKRLKARGRANKDYYFDDRTKMGSSFDWTISVSPLYKGWNLEIKNVDFMVFKDDWDVDGDEMPEHIEVQVQHQMKLNAAPGCVIAAMVGGNKLYLFFRKRNHAMGDAIEEAIVQFWQDIEERNEPEPCYYEDADMIIKLNSAAGLNVYDAKDDVALQELIQEFEIIKQCTSSMEKVEKAKKAELLEMIGPEYNKVTFGNYSLSCTRTKDTPERTITKEDVGNVINGRSGYRMCKLTVKKTKAGEV